MQCEVTVPANLETTMRFQRRTELRAKEYQQRRKPKLSRASKFCSRSHPITDVRFGSKADMVLYSINSSALVSKVGGMVRPSALAVLRLMTSSILVGNSTGRKAYFDGAICKSLSGGRLILRPGDDLGRIHKAQRNQQPHQSGEHVNHRHGVDRLSCPHACRIDRVIERDHERLALRPRREERQLKHRYRAD